MNSFVSHTHILKVHSVLLYSFNKQTNKTQTHPFFVIFVDVTGQILQLNVTKLVIFANLKTSDKSHSIRETYKADFFSFFKNCTVGIPIYLSIYIHFGIVDPIYLSIYLCLPLNSDRIIIIIINPGEIFIMVNMMRNVIVIHHHLSTTYLSHRYITMVDDIATTLSFFLKKKILYIY